eukprot:TRINITY_DN6302_c0_g1_i1.p1 TRINITY_DN6302_c0_g1~~TRINITY_DN6302_c0_g1_i1.p1  ORF type:complete len:354 (-),score=82.81 TRINITY_DN6302_c0_g1_i1:32-1000(-)
MTVVVSGQKARYIPAEVLGDGGAVRAVSAEVTKGGFHRELLLRFVFDARTLGKALPFNNELKCHASMLLSMPHTVYLDRYQLFDLHRKSSSSPASSQKTNSDAPSATTPEVLVLDNVDLEKPSFMVNDSLALVHHEFRFSPQLLAEGSRVERELRIPFHIRYQMPERGKDKYVTARLPSIKPVYISCASYLQSSSSASTSSSSPSPVPQLPSAICSRLSEKRQDIPFDVLPRALELCGEAAGRDSITTSSPSSSSSTSLLTTSFKSESLEFTVPVGDLEQAETLTQLTAGCYSIVALLLSGYVWSVWDSYRSLLSSASKRRA